MRMFHYWAAFAVLVVPALLAAAITGFAGAGERHLAVGLCAAVGTAALHTLVILFMLVTGRVLREAMRARQLGPQFLGELNAFFARKPAYPAAILGAFSITAAGVLGYGGRGFGLPAAVHWGAGLLALAANAWALAVEASALAANQRLIDRAKAELDRLDELAGTAARAEAPGAPVAPAAPERFTPAQRWLLAAIALWGPYWYWGLVVWRGNLGAVPLGLLAFSALASLAALACAWLTRGRGRTRNP
jgi:hypothetical protein